MTAFPDHSDHSDHSGHPGDSGITARIRAGIDAVGAQTGLLHREFGRAQSNWKADGTRVTPVDIAISENITKALRAQFPGDEFFSEELAGEPAPIPLRARFAWVLDPIDGTNNYALGLAHCAISLALLEHGAPAYGIVYDMSRSVMMHGGPGRGLLDGAAAARVSPDAPAPQSLVGFHSPYDKAHGAEARAIVENFKIRALGSSTLHLAYTAAGLLAGTVDHNVKIWDIAAAAALCLAGGGDVQFLNGAQFPLRRFDLRMPRIRYIAGNAAVCARLREVLEGAG
ncbi:MAG: inositol monophosphatase family protein [Opitutaceae bacterium]|nr:inositol monophosphatase family protein [Opitutaceae bacterium]